RCCWPVERTTATRPGIVSPARCSASVCKASFVRPTSSATPGFALLGGETGEPGDGDPGDGDPGDGDPGDGDPGDGDPGDGDGDACAPSELLCNGTCIDPMTDADNCGSCGNACSIMNNIGGCEAGI